MPTTLQILTGDLHKLSFQPLQKYPSLFWANHVRANSAQLACLAKLSRQSFCVESYCPIDINFDLLNSFKKLFDISLYVSHSRIREMLWQQTFTNKSDTHQWQPDEMFWPFLSQIEWIVFYITKTQKRGKGQRLRPNDNDLMHF